MASRTRRMREEDLEEERGIQNGSKLCFVLSCYTVLFFVLLNHAIWYLWDWGKVESSIDIIDWVLLYPESSPSLTTVLKKVGINLLLFAMFVGQHSLLAERNLVGTRIHQKVFVEWEINGSLYTLTTAIALHILKVYWNVIPIHLWKIDILRNLPIVNLFHAVAWMSLYGTTLMQDMPELVGLNQVVLANQGTCSKSSKFKAMLRKQRHLGFIPITLIICLCYLMTLDRFLYLLVIVSYSYYNWRDQESYEYIKEMTSKKRTRLSDGSSKKTD